MRKDDKYDRRTSIQKHFDNARRNPKNDIDSLILEAKEAGRKDNLNIWFKERRKEMTGYCDCGCGKSTSVDDNKYYRYCIAHVLPKSKFKSIATHKDNWLELAFFGGCHSVLDDKGYEYCKRTKPFLWDLIVKKFKILYPCIAPEEHKFIPQILLNELK